MENRLPEPLPHDVLDFFASEAFRGQVHCLRAARQPTFVLLKQPMRLQRTLRLICQPLHPTTSTQPSCHSDSMQERRLFEVKAGATHRTGSHS